MEIHKDIDPRGFLLNDNDIGVDHLGESTFADAIAESIHQVESPITIGLFAKWGSGKSFLLRHLESILKRYQRQSKVDDNKKERYSDTRVDCSDVSRAILWILCVAIIFFIILCTLLMAVKPEMLIVVFGIETPITAGTDATTNAPNTEETNSTTQLKADEVTESTLQEAPQYLRTLKIIGLIFIPIEIMIVFLIGCCGNGWFSLTYYGSCRLLTYGAFTKLPMRKTHSDIVEDPGEKPAYALKQIRPEDRRLAMAASEAEVFSKRYIFVDFKAWEYAGSDTLWAGIITNITDAIEAEFGTITARLFRMLSIEEIPRNILDTGNRTLYIELGGGAQESEVLDMMKQFGVVTTCQRIISGERRYWRVVYSSVGEFRNAKECLAIEGLQFVEEDPRKDNMDGSTAPQYRRGEAGRESRRKLLNRKDDVEMKTFKGNNTNDNNNAEDNVNIIERFTLPPKVCCCNRFCSHFLKYPAMLCCLPRLVWWILILVCSLLIPIIAYVIAEYLDLDVYRTYRVVPVMGQILLWLPAGIAVTSVILRFVWAMCHSQRKRINEALDGTKTRMADQLGFMDKVKTEVEVITRLIQCARFTHQKDYKIVITIDDLDRVPLKKVQSVLEAVSILLSDKSSPFICLIAVDPRIVVKCIEEGMGEVLRQAKVTGHEYLKKIINLPICLPEISDAGKKRFIAGLIDQADQTITYRAQEEMAKKRSTKYQNGNTTDVDSVPPVIIREGSSPRTVEIDSSPDRKATDVGNFSAVIVHKNSAPQRDEVDSNPDPALPIVQNCTNPIGRRNSLTSETTRRNLRSTPLIELDHKSFLFNCRKFIYHDEELHKHLQGNPRNIKRLFNVISLSAVIINCFHKKQKRRRFIHSHATDDNQRGLILDEDDRLVRTEDFAKDLVRWVVLADQWPYRTSYVLQVIEDADQRVNAGIEDERIPDDWTIFEIFQNKVQSEYEKGETLLSLDGDPDIFYSFIKLLRDCGFTKTRIKKLEKFTVNLDSSIRHTIAFYRDLSCMNPQQTKIQDNSGGDDRVEMINGNSEVKKQSTEVPKAKEVFVEEQRIDMVETGHRRDRKLDDHRISLPLVLEHC